MIFPLTRLNSELNESSEPFPFRIKSKDKGNNTVVQELKSGEALERNLIDSPLIYV